MEIIVFQDNNAFNSVAYQQTSQHSSLSESHPYVCVNCGRTYMWKSNLQRHMKLECGKEPNILCPYCPYRTKRTDELKKHMKRIHNIFSVY